MEGKGIAIAGNLICDVLHTIGTYPRMGRLTQIKKIERNVGGACNLILDLAKLDPDLPVKISGLVGADEEGRYVLNVMKKYANIDVSDVGIRGETSRTIVMDAADAGQRTFFYYPGAGDDYRGEDIGWERLDADIFQLEYLLLMKTMDSPDGEYGTHAARVLKQARDRGMRTSIDVVSEESGRAGGIIAAALPYVDYCAINELEAEAATGLPLQDNGDVKEENVWKALEMLRDMGVSRWTAIHSRYCSYGLDIESRERVKVRSLSLPEGFIKGTTGAGDAFLSGVLYEAYKGGSLREALTLGTAAAACSLQSVSGTDGMKSVQEVMELYRGLR